MAVVKKNSAALKALMVIIFTSQFFYTSKLFYSPVYVFVAVSLILFVMMYCVLEPQLATIKRTNVILFSMAGYITLTTLVKSAEFSAYTNFMCGLVCFACIRWAEDKIGLKDWVALLELAVKTGALILGADSCWRLLHPQMPDPNTNLAEVEDNNRFYLYKFGSLMFADSNTTALLSLILFFSALFLRREMKIRNTSWMVMHFLIIISSLSRASWVAMVLGLICFSGSRILKILSVFFCIFSFPIIAIFFLNDGSAMSKFYILNLVINYLQNASFFELMMGIGLDNSIHRFGIYTHSLFLTLLVETGITGMLLYGLLIRFTFKDSGGRVAYVWVPSLIAGFSYFLYIGSPFLFVPVAAIINISHSMARNDFRRL